MLIIYTTSFNIAAYIITLTWDDTRGLDTDKQEVSNPIYKKFGPFLNKVI